MVKFIKSMVRLFILVYIAIMAGCNTSGLDKDSINNTDYNSIYSSI